jgi:soluble lytic murein transglycosylase-like protein
MGIQSTQTRSREPRRLELAHVLVVGALLVGAGIVAKTARAAGVRPEPLASTAANLQIARLMAELDAAKGRLAVNDLRLDRLSKVGQYSTLYQIPNDVAARIYDAALAQGIHPSLGFQLVKVESRFKPYARSARGALGYTQVRIATAKAHDPSITERDLLNPDINLRVGFGILKRLLSQFDHDLEMALRAYNLGPTGAVLALVDTTDAAGGADYAARVLRGIRRVRGETSGRDR